MSQISAMAKERIQAQGFCGLDDAAYAAINYPLRFAPAICMVWAATGTALASPTILWALAPFGALGALLSGHPFDVLYNYGLRHLFGTPALPRYGTRRRLACAVATTWLIGAGLAFYAGMPVAGTFAGGAVVAGTLLQVSTGICPPAALAGRFLGKVVCDSTAA
jgi:hypothetical protein